MVSTRSMRRGMETYGSSFLHFSCERCVDIECRIGIKNFELDDLFGCECQADVEL